jgi:hypothetical protein
MDGQGAIFTMRTDQDGAFVSYRNIATLSAYNDPVATLRKGFPLSGSKLTTQPQVPTAGGVGDLTIRTVTIPGEREHLHLHDRQYRLQRAWRNDRWRELHRDRFLLVEVLRNGDRRAQDQVVILAASGGPKTASSGPPPA